MIIKLDLIRKDSFGESRIYLRGTQIQHYKDISQVHISYNEEINRKLENFTDKWNYDQIFKLEVVV